MKRILLTMTIIAILIPFFLCEVKADSTVYETAISEIQNNTNGNYTISLKNDIEITETTTIPTNGNLINNGNIVTIIGNGHESLICIRELLFLTTMDKL